MGNPKQKWTSEEEDALRAGVLKHGLGKWKLIQSDPELNIVLHSRSNIDLKDKWRNMHAALNCPRDKLRPSKPKPPQDSPAALPITPQTPAVPPLSTTPFSPAEHVKDNTAKDLPDAKNGPRYNEMIIEAVAAAKEQIGLDIGSIVSYIEQRVEKVPSNFRKLLGQRLKRLVQQDKLEKVDNNFRLKSNPMGTTTSNRKESWAKQPVAAAYLKASDPLEEAAKTAAFKVVEAESKSHAAAEAVKEAEKVTKLAEETHLILQIATEIFDRCTRGEVVLVSS